MVIYSMNYWKEWCSWPEHGATNLEIFFKWYGGSYNEYFKYLNDNNSTEKQVETRFNEYVTLLIKVKRFNNTFNKLLGEE